jgi:hypothetical protein
MEAGQKLGRFVFFSGGEQSAIILFQAAQARLDAAVMLMFALTGAHPPLG